MRAGGLRRNKCDKGAEARGRELSGLVVQRCWPTGLAPFSMGTVFYQHIRVKYKYALVVADFN